MPLGLMNGAQGVVVAIVYASPGEQRTDQSTLAGVGYPSSTLGAFPRGEPACPVPDFVVVHFPAYKGPACFDNLPTTWVPVPCAEVRNKTLQSVTRAGIPLRLAWALTIHKSQGITAHEGCIVSFGGCRGPNPVGKLGMAFVAWTRVTNWKSMAFHKLPPLTDFLSARLTKDFVARAEFESKADAMFARLLERRGTSPEALLAEHEQHFRTATLAKEGHEPNGAELADLRAMLSAVGVAPISDSVSRYCEEQSGRKATGLWSIVASFRAQKPKKNPGKALQVRGKSGSGGKTLLTRTGTQGPAASEADAAAETSAAATMIDMGFKEVDITCALEKTSFQFRQALVLLLNGLDAQRTKYDTLERFRRHSAKTVRALDCEVLGSGEVLTQYSQRTRSELQFDAHVRDLGQYAGRTSGACFWLCLAAGLAERGPDVLAQALPGNAPAHRAAGQLTAQGVQRCVDAGVRHSPLGVVAEALRTQFCGGEAAVLLRADMKNIIYAAFAGLDVRGPVRTEALYNRWVQKLATKEYADELVVMSVALEFGIRITVVPFTPPTALVQWAITSYGPENATVVVHMGNNNLHYVYLSRES